MKLLDLFSGTGSVGRVARDLGFSVISLDLKNANINTDILSWDYKQLGVSDLGISSMHRIVISDVLVKTHPPDTL